MELININCDIINCYIPTLVYCSAWWEDIGNPFAHNKKKKSMWKMSNYTYFDMVIIIKNKDLPLKRF